MSVDVDYTLPSDGADIACFYDPIEGITDIKVGSGGSLATDDEMETAVLLSLLCNRRAGDSDKVPYGSTKRGGFWGDAIATTPGDEWGSKLWLLDGKVTKVNLVLAGQYCREALAWMIEDGVASSVYAQAEAIRLQNGTAGMAIRIVIKRDNVVLLSKKYQYVWEQ